VFTSVELSRLERACQGRSFAQRRDAAVIAVFWAAGIRLPVLAGIRYDAEDAERSDLDLWQREITVWGKDGKARIVRISYQTARTLDRYIRARSRHAQAWRTQLWLGVNNRGPMTANGIYQMIARRDRQPRLGEQMPCPSRVTIWVVIRGRAASWRASSRTAESSVTARAWTRWPVEPGEVGDEAFEDKRPARAEHACDVVEALSCRAWLSSPNSLCPGVPARPADIRPGGLAVFAWVLAG
jgi:integrase